MRMKWLATLLIFSIIIAGCANKSETTGNESQNSDIIQIYTTLYPLEDFTKKIGGKHVDVKNILPPGVDAHTYEPTSKTMIEIAKADALIYNGLGMEAFVEKMISSLKNEKVQMVEASNGIELNNNQNEAESHVDNNGEHEEHNDHHEADTHEEHDEHEEHNEADNNEEHGEHEHDHGGDNPHVWLNPERAMILAENIKNVLIELKPEAKAEFTENFDSLKTELDTLDQEFKALIDSKENRKILVSHAAYGEWEEAYGIEQIAVSGLSPTNEPSQKQLQDIIERARMHELKYVIFEENITPKIAEVVRKELNAEALTLHNLEVLSEEDIENDEDYFSLMRKNIETLDKVLN